MRAAGVVTGTCWTDGLCVACAVPKRALHGITGVVALRAPCRCGHRHLLDWLDPSVPLMFLFGGEEEAAEGAGGEGGGGNAPLVGVSRWGNIWWGGARGMRKPLRCWTSLHRYGGGGGVQVRGYQRVGVGKDSRTCNPPDGDEVGAASNLGTATATDCVAM